MLYSGFGILGAHIGMTSLAMLRRFLRMRERP
jgi:hypothetical protein